MKNQVVVDAFLTIAAALSGDSNYRWMPPREKDEIYLDRHPFDPDTTKDMSVMWAGFSSDDFRSMLRYALKPSEGFLTGNEPPRFIMWFILADEIEFHEDRSKYECEPRYNIFAEIRNEYQSILVGGMTNYSGSGGSAYREIEAVFTFLATTLGVKTVEARFLPHGWDERAYDLANKAYTDSQESY